MSKKHLTDLDLRQNQLLNPTFQRTSGAPTASPTQSQFHFDTVDEKFKYYGNGIWRVPAVEINDLEDVNITFNSEILITSTSSVISSGYTIDDTQATTSNLLSAQRSIEYSYAIGIILC